MVDRRTISPLIDDVQKQYVKYRKMGKTRTATIELICEDYAQELRDADDKLAVLIGLSLSLCKKRELCEPIATITVNEIQRAYQAGWQDNRIYSYLKEIESYLRDKTVYGDEAIYKRASSYVPDWKVGDIFSHTLTFPSSEALGIKGWHILFCKVGEYVDEFEVHHQLMLVSVCSSEKKPSCQSDLQKIGFLPMMRVGDKSEYLAQMTIKNKKDENAFELTKIGSYPDISLPDDCSNENPLTAMPLLGRLRHDDGWPCYEDQLCRIYKKYRHSQSSSSQG